MQDEIRNHPQNGWIRAENNCMNKMDNAQVSNVQYVGQTLTQKILRQMYKKRIISLSKQNESLRKPYEKSENLINLTEYSVCELVKASYILCNEHRDSLIAIERITPLDEQIKTGIDLDAIISSQLIVNIFQTNTPLHDGAIIISNNRIAAGVCYLVLSDNPLYWNVGYNYRAAIGMSEVSDCMVIVTSGETEMVSFAYDGQLYHAQSQECLIKMVYKVFSYMKNGLERNVATHTPGKTPQQGIE